MIRPLFPVRFMVEPRSSPANAPPADRVPASAGRRRRFLRFGLRSALVFAVVFCLFFSWIGKGLYRVRQEDAAIETILRSGGSLYAETDGRTGGPPDALGEPSALPVFERAGDMALRSVGWRKRPDIATVELRIDDADDPDAEEATAALAQFPEIRRLSLTGRAFDDASLLALNRLPRLIELRLVRTQATAEGLKKIATPPQIEHLYVRYASRDVVSGAAAFRGLRKIECLNVQIARDDIAALGSLPELEELDLQNVHLVGEEVLAPLADAKKLRRLEIDSPKRPDADDLRVIAGLPGLQRLSMLVREPDLPLLAGATKLRYLDARLVSQEAGRAFSLDHPDCVVRVHGPRLSSVYLLNGELTEPP